MEHRRYRQVPANRARATKGHLISRFAAYGYDLSQNRLTYVVDEQQAHWVRQMFDWYASGRALTWIAKAMANCGVPSARGKNIWYPEKIRTVLRNEVYKGTYVSNRYNYQWVWEDGSQKRLYSQKPEDEWIHVPIPAIVSGGQWDEVQRLLAVNKKRSLRNAKKHEWLFPGLLTCVCGYALKRSIVLVRSNARKNKFALSDVLRTMMRLLRVRLVHPGGNGAVVFEPENSNSKAQFTAVVCTPNCTWKPVDEPSFL